MSSPRPSRNVDGIPPGGRSTSSPEPNPQLRTRVHLRARHRRGGPRHARQILRDADHRRRARVARRIQQRLSNSCHRLKALGAVLRQRAKQDQVDLLGQLLDDGARRRRGHGHVLDDDLAVTVAAERDLAREHLEQQHAERIDVGAVIDLDLPLALLGGHVIGRPHHRTGARLVADLLVGQRQLREAEVEHLDEVTARAAVVAQEDVLGLEIAVDDSLLVRGVQRVRDLSP